jgi:hypothetical protein
MWVNSKCAHHLGQMRNTAPAAIVTPKRARRCSSGNAASLPRSRSAFSRAGSAIFSDNVEACCSLSAARLLLGVKPIVITGAGHANTVGGSACKTLVSEVFDGEATVAQ